MAALIMFSLIGAIGGAGFGLLNDESWSHMIGMSMIAAAFGAVLAIIVVALGSTE